MSKQHDLSIEGHKIVALGFNEDKPAPPAIFIHGITSSVSFWTVRQTPVFDQHFRWYSLSLPGHYPAVLPPGFRNEDLTPDLIARVLITAITQLVGDQPVLLVGHSTGGFAALNIASHTPEIASGVVSISGFAHGRWIGWFGRFQSWVRWNQLGRTLFKAGYKFNQISPVVNRPFWRVYAADVPNMFKNLLPVHDQYFANFRYLNINSLVPYFYRMPDIDITDLLPRITVPTLALAGDSDPIVPSSQAQLIAGKVPNAQLVYMRGVGHVPFLERPEEYHRILTEWVKNREIYRLLS